MKTRLPQNVIEMAELRDRVTVFRDREHAGEILAGMLARYEGSRAILFAVPAGGVPVAAVMAERLRLRLEVAVVSKITMPWNAEAGYGAVAFDGSVLLNKGILARIGLTNGQIQTITLKPIRCSSATMAFGSGKRPRWKSQTP